MRIQKTYPKASKRIQTYPNVSKRIQTYPNVSKRIQAYPNVSKIFAYPQKIVQIDQNRSKRIQTYPKVVNVSKIVCVSKKTAYPKTKPSKRLRRETHFRIQKTSHFWICVSNKILHLAAEGCQIFLDTRFDL